MAVSTMPSSVKTSRVITPSVPNTTLLDSPTFSKKLSSTNATPPLPPPSRGATPSNPRRKRSKKRSKSGSRKATRWQLGEDVAEILSGQFFRRIEVDELLTPDRLKALGAERECQLQLTQSRSSSDTIRTVSTDGSETSVEPFHLQDLPSRIGAAGVGGPETLPDVVAAPQQREFAVKDKTSCANISTIKDDCKADNMTASGGLRAPSPPAKNPARFLSKQSAPVLITIPEVVITMPDVAASSTDTCQRHVGRTFALVDEGDFLFFQSTNYTLNHAAFRHGPIRFPKSEVVKGMKIDPDDTLDWTAFQMAILGGAGDLFSDPVDISQRSEAEEVEDIAEWFESFGFQNHGRLISKSSPTPRSARYRAATVGSCPKAIDHDLPIPVGTEHPNGFWNEGEVDASKFLSDGCSIRRWTMGGTHPRRHNRGSVESLPPSPMMDLVMVRGCDGEPEMVPMGYNLGHDLGDFLQWETENVYAFH
ncbi:hypothetical protein CCHL11_06892 [Colletotrichum chlorophyti]|uniref:Uncharacterized protein n=1 Tax=Colletotrichum chlorophyti TaxID=708187 RepID=A0A1Q8RBE7_9PEZI|nr:hypothetical protein CCHL11_06892 [Colletotrichum chlorophyti]